MSDKNVRTLMSDDPDDPRCRLRVERVASGPYEGLIEIAEESLTSASDTAQVTEIQDRLTTTPVRARWLRVALGELLGMRPIRRYVVREERGHWVGTFVIDDAGYFSTVSDYGNYAYYWSSAGECFRSFLTRLEPDYLCGKLNGGRPQVYNGDETAKAVREYICNARRGGTIHREEARKEWDLVAKHSSLDSPIDFGTLAEEER